MRGTGNFEILITISSSDILRGLWHLAAMVNTCIFHPDSQKGIILQIHYVKTAMNYVYTSAMR